jgi:hypothetical protein
VWGYAIQSVLWQTEKNFKLMIVGDIDDTAKVVAAFTESRIRIQQI